MNEDKTQAEKIGLAQKNNLIKKLKSGRPLTRPELQMLQDYDSQNAPDVDLSKDYPATIKVDRRMALAIAERFQISERKGYGWLKKLKDLKRSRGWPVKKVFEEVEKRKISSTDGGGNGDIKRKILEEQFLLLRARRLEAESQLVKASDVRNEWSRIASGLRNAVDSWEQHNGAKFPHLLNEISLLSVEFLERVKAATDVCADSK